MSQTAKQIYMDYTAGTPCSQSVVAAMSTFFNEQFANPSSIHADGVVMKQVVDHSRESVALQMGVKKDEVYFMSGGTESINTAILGIGRYFLTDKTFENKPHVVTSTIEHPAVLEPIAQLEKEGCEVSYIVPNKDGLITETALQAVVKETTVLVTIGLVNGEVGTIQPIRKLAKILHNFKKEQGRDGLSYPYIHTDAAQAPLIMSVKQEKFLVDLISLDSSKIYGPKFGVLCKKQHVPVTPLLFGGSQEKKLRPGTENTPYIVGMDTSLSDAQQNKEVFVENMQTLKKYFIEQLQAVVPKAIINGTVQSKYSSPLITNVCFGAYGINAEFFVLQLDAAGISVSAMTACKSLDDTAHSYVVSEITDAHKDDVSDATCAGSSIRFSFGVTTTRKEIDTVITAVQKILQ